MKGLTGSCLCGQVAFEASEHLGLFQYCHCSRCRKFTGSAFAPNILVPPEAFAWKKGAELVGRYEHEPARHFATCFCKNCGSSLPWLTRSGRVVAIPAGTLDGAVDIEPSQNLHFASRAQWYRDPGTMPAHDAFPLKDSGG